MAIRHNMWVHDPPKLPKPRVPDAVKTEVEAKARALIETVLKPEHVKAPAAEERFNYIADIYAKWYRNYFCFCAKYCCPGPHAQSLTFEEKFARLEYVSTGRFYLSYMRHTGQWQELCSDLSEDECLAAIRDEPHFLP